MTKKEIINHLLAEAWKAHKEDPTNRYLLMALTNAARMHAGFPIPGTTKRHVMEGRNSSTTSMNLW